MLFEDKEKNLIEDFRLFATTIQNSTFAMSDSDELQTVVKSLLDDNSWNSEWIDSSLKNDPPPDFYNNKQKLMMEVMRIDDHSFQRNGKTVNPTNQKAREVEKELRQKGFLDSAPFTQLIINAPTDLPSSEDHNYSFYKDGFKRVVEKHISHIDLYRKNHPNYKLVFFVFDESSMYCKVDEPNKTIKQGEMFEFQSHLWFLDKAFVDVFKESGIDYLIWFAPYKWQKQEESDLGLPMACVYDCNDIQFELIDYDPVYMMSADE